MVLFMLMIDHSECSGKRSKKFSRSSKTTYATGVALASNTAVITTIVAKSVNNMNNEKQNVLLEIKGDENTIETKKQIEEIKKPQKVSKVEKKEESIKEVDTTSVIEKKAASEIEISNIAQKHLNTLYTSMSNIKKQVYFQKITDVEKLSLTEFKAAVNDVTIFVSFLLCCLRYKAIMSHDKFKDMFDSATKIVEAIKDSDSFKNGDKQFFLCFEIIPLIEKFDARTGELANIKIAL